MSEKLISEVSMSIVSTFQEEYPSIESYWRSIILFGRNVASYKFALAQSLLELSEKGMASVTLLELADPFSRNLCKHVAQSPKQITSQSSTFLDACKNFNDGVITYDELISITVKFGFNNVIDAFHVVNEGNIPVPFYEKDYSGRSKRIILTDEIFRLHTMPFYANLSFEAEARWNLVETAWELGISRNLLSVKYDDEAQLLFVDDKIRRKNVTSARDALNGYQKGRCFYCFRNISVSNDSEELCDVDHFYPHVLQPFLRNINLNGVWNLVLACPDCNRGSDGKFARTPAIKYLERLSKRNEFLISSHHPLRDTIMAQTGNTAEERHRFLAQVDKDAINILLHRWDTLQIGEKVF